jgi:hypothetical protein
MLIIVLAFSCITNAEDDAEIFKLTEHEKKVRQIIYEGFDFNLGETKHELINNLGNPKRLKTSEVNNIHYPNEITDKVYELFYDGLYIRILHATQGDREFITNISITDNKYKIIWDLEIGSSKSDIKNILGVPDEEDVESIVYQTTLEYIDTVKFHFKNDAVYKIDWFYWVD